jgi:hypothetical protein
MEFSCLHALVAVRDTSLKEERMQPGTQVHVQRNGELTVTSIPYLRLCNDSSDGLNRELHDQQFTEFTHVYLRRLRFQRRTDKLISKADAVKLLMEGFEKCPLSYIDLVSFLESCGVG